MAFAPRAEDLVLIVCPKCQQHGRGGSIATVSKFPDMCPKLVSSVRVRRGRIGTFNSATLGEARWEHFDFDGRSKRETVDVECRDHGRRPVSVARLEQELARHRPGDRPRILRSNPRGGG
jgi:hypothetical protein